ncbi:MAG TPA: hypothetical protein VHW44_00235 [Pseudonocardiaceae bacterium]|nr:hypothetical protein [Pseudonocardiaceae bacterium]
MGDVLIERGRIAAVAATIEAVAMHGTLRLHHRPEDVYLGNPAAGIPRPDRRSRGHRDRRIMDAADPMTATRWNPSSPVAPMSFPRRAGLHA